MLYLEEEKDPKRTVLRNYDKYKNCTNPVDKHLKYNSYLMKIPPWIRHAKESLSKVASTNDLEDRNKMVNFNKTIREDAQSLETDLPDSTLDEVYKVLDSIAPLDATTDKRIVKFKEQTKPNSNIDLKVNGNVTDISTKLDKGCSLYIEMSDLQKNLHIKKDGNVFNCRLHGENVLSMRIVGKDSSLIGSPIANSKSIDVFNKPKDTDRTFMKNNTSYKVSSLPIEPQNNPADAGNTELFESLVKDLQNKKETNTNTVKESDTKREAITFTENRLVRENNSKDRAEYREENLFEPWNPNQSTDITESQGNSSFANLSDGEKTMHPNDESMHAIFAIEKYLKRFNDEEIESSKMAAILDYQNQMEKRLSEKFKMEIDEVRNKMEKFVFENKENTDNEEAIERNLSDKFKIVIQGDIKIIDKNENETINEYLSAVEKQFSENFKLSINQDKNNLNLENQEYTTSGDHEKAMENNMPENLKFEVNEVDAENDKVYQRDDENHYVDSVAIEPITNDKSVFITINEVVEEGKKLNKSFFDTLKFEKKEQKDKEGRRLDDPIIISTVGNDGEAKVNKVQVPIKSDTKESSSVFEFEEAVAMTKDGIKLNERSFIPTFDYKTSPNRKCLHGIAQSKPEVRNLNEKLDVQENFQSSKFDYDKMFEENSGFEKLVNIAVENIHHPVMETIEYSRPELLKKTDYERTSSMSNNSSDIDAKTEQIDFKFETKSKTDAETTKLCSIVPSNVIDNAIELYRLDNLEKKAKHNEAKRRKLSLFTPTEPQNEVNVSVHKEGSESANFCKSDLDKIKNDRASFANNETSAVNRAAHPCNTSLASMNSIPKRIKLQDLISKKDENNEKIKENSTLYFDEMKQKYVVRPGGNKNISKQLSRKLNNKLNIINKTHMSHVARQKQKTKKNKNREVARTKLYSSRPNSQSKDLKNKATPKSNEDMRSNQVEFCCSLTASPSSLVSRIPAGPNEEQAKAILAVYHNQRVHEDKDMQMMKSLNKPSKLNTLFSRRKEDQFQDKWNKFVTNEHRLIGKKRSPVRRNPCKSHLDMSLVHTDDVKQPIYQIPIQKITGCPHQRHKTEPCKSCPNASPTRCSPNNPTFNRIKNRISKIKQLISSNLTSRAQDQHTKPCEVQKHSKLNKEMDSDSVLRSNPPYSEYLKDSFKY